MVRDIVPQMFETEVRAAKEPVLLEFYAPWCPRCAMMEDVVEQFARTNVERIRTCRINEKGAQGLMERLGIDRVPAFLAFSGGRLTGVVTGTVSVEVLESLF